MGWFYSGNPADNNRDAVRFLVGDVIETDQQVSDEEIAFALGEVSSNKYRAAALVCDHLSSRYARESDEQVGDLRKSYSQRSKSYDRRASELRARYHTVTGIAPYVGGVSVSTKESERAVSDWDQPGIRRGGMDHPEGDTST